MTVPGGAQPPLGIGMPVYNGEAYVGEAIDSLLTQSYGDFELLIADNGSTDSTMDILADRATRDQRVRVVRHPRNLGAIANHNYVFTHSRGRMFKWAAADDRHHVEFLSRCVAVLDDEPGAVGGFSAIRRIDDAGHELDVTQQLDRARCPDPVARFGEVIDYGVNCAVAFAVLSRDAVARTRLMLPFWGSDRVFLAELVLAGSIAIVDEPLFEQRDHAGQLTHQGERRGRSAYRASQGSTFLTWRHAGELTTAVRRADLSPAERRGAYRELGRWANRNRVKFGRSAARGAVEVAKSPLRRLSRGRA